MFKYLGKALLIGNLPRSSNCSRIDIQKLGTALNNEEGGARHIFACKI